LILIVTYCTNVHFFRKKGSHQTGSGNSVSSLSDFQFFFTGRFSGEFSVMTLLLKIDPTTYFAALPCKALKQETAARKQAAVSSYTFEVWQNFQ